MMTLNPADGFPHTPEAYAEFAGDAAKQAQQTIRDLDSAMRANYAANVGQIAENIHPILYVESTFDGGRYTLVLEDVTFTKENVGSIYDTCKAVAHIPLGIFSIASGYGAFSGNGQWTPALQSYRASIRRVAENEASLVIEQPEVRAAVDGIVGASLAYIDSVIAEGEFSLSGFSGYAHSLNDALLVCQNAAARNQVDTMTRVLSDWRAMIGDEQWDRMYVVCNALWTLSKENAHELIIKSLMKPELRDTHVIVTEAAPTLAEAKSLLGRIVGDRIMAELVFATDGAAAFRQNIYSLSTQRDLLSQAVEAVLANGNGTSQPTLPSCPIRGRLTEDA